MNDKKVYKVEEGTIEVLAVKWWYKMLPLGFVLWYHRRFNVNIPVKISVACPISDALPFPTDREATAEPKPSEGGVADTKGGGAGASDGGSNPFQIRTR